MLHRKTENPHAIFIPFPLQGHLIPSVLLAIKLASKGFTITFINTESIHHSITKSSSPSAINGGHHDGDIFAEARSSGLDIRYATVSDGLPLGFDRSLNHDQYMECLLHVFSAHVDELVGNLVKSDASINCLIADSFHVWPLMISNKYKLVNISFWTEPALVLILYYHMDLLKKNGHYDPLSSFLSTYNCFLFPLPLLFRRLPLLPLLPRFLPYFLLVSFWVHIHMQVRQPVLCVRT